MTNKQMTETLTALLNAMANCQKIIVAQQTRIEKLDARVYQLECEAVAVEPIREAHVPAIPAMFLDAPKTTSPKAKKARKVETVEAVPASFANVLAVTAKHVKTNMRKGVFNEKIIPQIADDPRVYLPTAQHRPFKLAARAAGMTLVDASLALQEAIA
jgi:hypothetical protein